MGTKNGIVDLADELFEQLDRLNNDDLTTEEIVMEGERANSMVNVAKQLIDIYKVQLDACKFSIENGYQGIDEVKILPKQLVSND